jgi:hypothetical protein
MEYLFLFLLVGFFPAILAKTRHHKNVPAITALCIFALVGPMMMYAMTSMLFVGLVMIIAVAMWIGAFVWACTSNVEQSPYGKPRDPRWAKLHS